LIEILRRNLLTVPYFILFILGVLTHLAQAAEGPTAVILCYPTDKITKAACDEVEKKLKYCETAKVKVIRKDNLDLDSLSTALKNESIPPHSPIFIVGHGMADEEHRHYLAVKMFWKDHPEKVKSELIPQLKDEGNLISGKELNSSVRNRLTEPALWYLSCHSGGNCTEGGNVGASCSSWEATSISQLNNSLLKVNLKIDPSTRTILNLLCKSGEFDKADHDHNGYIENKEWLQAFSNPEEKSVTLSLPKKSSQGDVSARERVLRQLSEESTFCEEGGKINLTLKNCVNAASLNGESCLATPVLSHFSLPSWETQKTAASAQIRSKTDSTHK